MTIWVYSNQRTSGNTSLLRDHLSGLEGLLENKGFDFGDSSFRIGIAGRINWYKHKSGKIILTRCSYDQYSDSEKQWFWCNVLQLIGPESNEVETIITSIKDFYYMLGYETSCLDELEEH